MQKPIVSLLEGIFSYVMSKVEKNDLYELYDRHICSRIMRKLEKLKNSIRHSQARAAGNSKDSVYHRFQGYVVV